MLCLALAGLIAAAVYLYPRTLKPIVQPGTSRNVSKKPTTLDCIAKLPLDVRIGQKIMLAGYSDSLPTQTEIFQKYHVGGVILMDQTSKNIIAVFKSQQTIPPIVATDQEGGTVQRYTIEGSLPGASEITSLSVDQAYNRYLADEKYLASIGVTTNFAPVVDVSYAGHDPLPGRIYSADPSIVTAYAAAAIKAAKNASIQPVIKHFPGLGSASGNTDFGSATTASYNVLKRKDLLPYHDLADLNPDVMVNNAIVPGLSDSLPASLSRNVIQDTLRTKYGYHDVVVYTDSLSARAISKEFTLAQASIRAWSAGADFALIVQLDQPNANVEKIVRDVVASATKAYKTEQLDSQELNQSVERIFARKHIDACRMQLPRS